MPIYEYECEKCAYRFELKRRFDEDDGHPCCPQCRGNVRQLFSPPVIFYKGPGFYVTDSRIDRNHPSEDGKANKIEEGKKEDRKTDKVENSKKEDGKTDKVESSKKEDGKTDKVESSKKEDGK
jgi:putative FmdB family regulatory protein